MNDPGQTATRRNGIRELIASYDGLADFDELPSATDATVGLVSLGFIGSALRRAMLLWLVTAMIGLFAGVTLAMQHNSAHSATTTVLVDNPGDTQGAELQTDAALAQSVPVAAAVVTQLRISQTPVSFLNTYTAGSYAPQIMKITATGPTDAAAVQRVSVIATQFLAFRAKYLQVQLQLTTDSLNQQITRAEQNLSSIDQQVSKASAEPASPDQNAQLLSLSKQQAAATSELASVKANASSAQLQAETTTSQMVHGSEVLSSAMPVAHPVKKTLVTYAGAGLIAGLFIGMAIVFVAAVTTVRLRRRDDIAIAVGAPVRLSVGRLRGRRWLPELRGKSGRRNRDMERVVGHLGSALPVTPKGVASLAVVAVDDAPTVAQAVVRLAIVCSQQRKRVVLADLSPGAPAARRLGVTHPGINMANPDGVPVVVVVPESEDTGPVGPLSSPRAAQASERLAEACARADLLISIVTLNPAFSGDYLGTWATDAVAVITAGQSTATRVHAAGEMIRLAGIRLGSVVVLGADRNDESLGTVTAEYQTASTLRS